MGQTRRYRRRRRKRLKAEGRVVARKIACQLVGHQVPDGFEEDRGQPMYLYRLRQLHVCLNCSELIAITPR